MLTEDTSRIVSRFFDGGSGPSHDELTRFFKRVGLECSDPLIQYPQEVTGKMKRCRAVFSYALDNDVEAGSRLVKIIIEAVRGMRGFSPGSENYIGEDLFLSLKEALDREGYTLELDGTISTKILEGLSGVELTDALKAYIKRAKRGENDAALLTGTSKDLLEATARHILVEIQGSYPENAGFPMTLYNVFSRLNLEVLNPEDFKIINSKNPIKGVEKALFLLGISINRLRNAEGVGHGRPFEASVTGQEAKMAIECMGIISEYLLAKNGSFND